MRANDVEYFAPAQFDDELEIHIRVSNIGRTSMTYEFAAFKVPDGTLLATAHQTLVFIDLEKRRPIPIPSAYRAPFGVG
jgi:acyl-CoA thioester hydrolase